MRGAGAAGLRRALPLLPSPRCSLKVDSCGGEQDVALWASLLAAGGPPGRAHQLENCHNGPWLPEPPRKAGGPPWCPFSFYRTSLDIEDDYRVVMGVRVMGGRGVWGHGSLRTCGARPYLRR